MLYIGSFLLLRSFIRHGCDSILSDCVSHLVALVPLGSLGVAELALLSSAGAESDDQNMLSPSIASNLAQEAYRLIVRSCEKTSTKDDCDGSNNLLNLVAQSTAFQYLATYVGMEGLRAFAPWLAPTIPEAQQAIKTLLGTKLMTSVELEQMFLTPQQQQRKVVSTEGGSTLSVVKMSLQLGRSYTFARFLTSIPRVFPATRTVVHGYCDTIVTRFMDLMFSKRPISSSSSASGGNDFASQCKSVGGIVLSSPLSMEELSTALEVVTALSTTAAELDDDNGSEAPRAVVGGLKRNAKAVAIILLDIIAKTMQCLDSAPLLAALLFPNDLHSADAVVTAVCARAADSAGTAIDPATTSGGWISKLFWHHVPAAAEVLTTALTCHPQARHVFHWELLFSDFVLWSCSHKASNKDEEQLRCDAMLVLAQIAFTQGQVINDQSVNQSIASTIGPYFTSTFAVVPRLPPSVVCALCCGAVLLQPEGSIACLRILHESHDDFSETSEFFLEQQSDKAKSSSVGKSSVLSFLDMLFHQSLSMGGSLEEHQSRGGAMNAQPSSSNYDSDQQGGEEISGWSSLQRIVECLQLLVPLFRFTEHSSWPHMVCGYMIRRLALSHQGAAGKAAVVAMQSDFMAMCIQDTLQTLHWEGFEAEDRKAAARSEGTHEFHAKDQENRSSTGGGDSWDDDEFAF
ncbi:Hypothetical protein, putative [Bodo saltans]|uniref:Uncharacterized protein n=1 Tax=Bodo saltans TaxID=75058 RepID=A0A0S4J4I9_BODSA|nr:Hypothetical protein, putative [Bodo saltans]|eukprot:CUG69906.1 Hypothetical protein, putative [Bodo saltans]